MVSLTHEQNIICSQTQLYNIVHGQAIICGQFFASHVVGFSTNEKEVKFALNDT